MNETLLAKIGLDADSSAADLEALMGKGDALEALLAKHPNTFSKTLQKLSLSASHITCRNVVLNPNTPKDVLMNLAPRFPGDFFKNPMFDWFFLEDPDFFSKLGKGVRKNILKRGDCPKSFLKWAATYGDFQERLAATINPKTTRESLMILAKPHDSVGILARAMAEDNLDLLYKLREPGCFYQVENFYGGEPLPLLDNILKNQSCPRSVMQWVAVNGKDQEKLALAMNKNVPVEILKALAVMGGDVGDAVRNHVKMAVCLEPIDFHALLKQEIKKELSGMDSVEARIIWIKHLIGKSQWLVLQPDVRLSSLGLSFEDFSDIPRDDILHQYEDFSLTVAECVARNPACPSDLLEKLALEVEGDVQKNVASNPATPLHVLEQLAFGEKFEVREAAAKNPASSLKVLTRLGVDIDSKIRICVAANRSAPDDALQILAVDGYEVRATVAGNPAASEVLLKKLSADKSYQVRLAVAGNKSTNPLCLKKLSDDKNEYVRDAAKKAMILPAGMRKDSLVSDFSERLSDVTTEWSDFATELTVLDKEWKNRLRLAKDISTHATVLEELAFDEVDDIVFGVALNQNTPSRSLRRFALQGVNERIASNITTPVAMLEEMAGNRDVRIRLRVACNSAMTASLLQKHGLYNLCAEQRIKKLIRNSLAGFSLVDSSHIGSIKDGEPMGVLYRALRDNCSVEFLRAEYSNLKHAPQDSLIAKIIDHFAWGTDYNERINSNAQKRRDIDRYKYIRLNFLCNSGVDVGFLIRYSSSSNWVDRLAVACNPACPSNILNILKNDGHHIVAQAARTIETTRAAQHGEEQGSIGISNAESSDVISTTVRVNFKTKCPNCKGTVKEDSGNYACCGVEGAASGCGFSFNKTQSGRAFKPAEVEVLLRSHKSGLLRGFISKAGKPFNAEMVLRFDEAKKTCRVVFDFVKDKKLEPVVLATSTAADVAPQPSLGACPKCGAAVHAHGTNYVCTNSLVSAVQPMPSCDFKTGQVILQQAISTEQLGKLLATRRTDLLDGFISARTQKTFKAMLVWDGKAGKVGFEFGSSRG
jgi:hypothetical protein